MNNTQYIVVETRTEHEFRVFTEEHPEIVLGFYGLLCVGLIIGFVRRG